MGKGRGMVLTERQRRMAGAAGLFVCGVACLGMTGLVARVTLHDALSDSAEGLIDEAIGKNVLTFISVSGVKSVLALLEGSSVGVGFDLEVGDLVQPLYDYVDFVWKILLYSLMILGLYKLVLETGMLTLGHQAAGIGLIVWSVGLVRPQWRRGAWVWGKRWVFGGLLFAYVVPLALLGTHYLSQRYTRPLSLKYAAEIERVRGELVDIRDDFLALRDRMSLTRPGESLEEAKSGVIRVASSVSELLWGSMFAFVYSALVVFFELFVLPLLSAFLLYKVLHLALDRSLETPFTIGWRRQPAASDA